MSKMRLEWNKFRPHTKMIVQLAGGKLAFVGKIAILLTLGVWPKAATQEIHFSITDLPTSYNGVLEDSHKTSSK